MLPTVGALARSKADETKLVRARLAGHVATASGALNNGSTLRTFLHHDSALFLPGLESLLLRVFALDLFVRQLFGLVAGRTCVLPFSTLETHPQFALRAPYK